MNFQVWSSSPKVRGTPQGFDQCTEITLHYLLQLGKAAGNARFSLNKCCSVKIPERTLGFRQGYMAATKEFDQASIGGEITSCRDKNRVTIQL